MINKLITELLYEKILLSEALTRAKLIALKVKDDTFKSWLSNELLGYKKGDLIPDYRILKCVTVGVLQHVNGYRQKIEVPTSLFDLDLRKKFEEVSINRSISDIESLSVKNSNAEFLRLPFDINLTAMLNNLLKIDMDEEAIVESGFQIFTQDLKGILDITKQKLIDILLQLRETFPNLESDFIYDKENIDKVSQIVNNNINISLENKNNQVMSNDNYENKGNTVVMGSNANVQIENLNQTSYNFPENFDYKIFAEQLSELKTKVIADASATNDGEKFKVVSDIIAAEKAIETKDNKSILKHLANGGKWLFETAKDIGVNIAADVIKKSMGI